MLLHFVQNVGISRFFKRSRYMIYRSIQNVPWRYVIGATMATPFIAIMQGTYLLYGTPFLHGALFSRWFFLI